MANKDNNFVIGIDDIQDDLHQQVLFEQNKKKTEKDIKRVNLLLPTHLYQESKRLGDQTGIGYQNTLKMAISIGLTELKQRLHP